MSLSDILFYVTRAFRFALCVCPVYAVLRLIRLKMKGQKPSLKHELILLAFTVYFAALVEIIAIRGGRGTTRTLLPIPLQTMINDIKNGAWPFFYHLVGNMIWFVPLGMFLGKKSLPQALLTGAAISLALECLQWLMMTGVTDIDDVILNTLGTAAGRILIKIPHPKRTQ